MTDIQSRLQNVPFPAGYQLTLGGETADQQEVFGRILTALAIAIMLMYFVLVVQFGSFLDPLAILLSLPLSLIGVMLALLVTGSTLNLMSLIGVILLMGIVAKNAILLIDFAKWSEESGMERARSAHRGRPRPAAADPDDDLRPDRRHGAGGAGDWRGRRFPGAARSRRDRRRGHVHAVDAARHPDRLRNTFRLA